MLSTLGIAFLMCISFFGLAAQAEVPTARSQAELPVSEVVVAGDLTPFTKTVDVSEPSSGIRMVTIRLDASQPAKLKGLSLELSFPSIDINGYWNSQQQVDRVNYYHCGFQSGASGAAPVLCFYNHELRNRITMAASDAVNTIKFDCGLKEEDVTFYTRLTLGAEELPATKSYQIALRLDTRNVAYHKSLADVRRWWEAMSAYTPAEVPDVAKRPMYSTWYSYHQNLDATSLVDECRLARQLGCHAIIIDDGWQTTDSNRGYAYTGDWRPERLNEMKQLVDRIHAEDMKVVLWYSLPFMGQKAENFKRFEGRYLYHWQGQGTYVLDPRYPDVREFMIRTYEQALLDWGLDGFKLDFIGWFKKYGDTRLTADDGRDFASVAAATDHLMTELTDRLRAIRPDVLIEFRQPYVGPVMRKYGNMFRGVDCPNNAAANRNEIVNLRLLSGDTAVHSDMFIWRPEESSSTAARQLLNVLFSVPQISVRLAETSPEHRDMLGYWLDYWNRNRDVLLGGDFLPSNPGANYPSITASTAAKQISVLYETSVACEEREGIQDLDVVNAAEHRWVIIQLTTDWDDCQVSVSDATGSLVEERKTNLAAGVHRFEVPASGKISLVRRSK